MGISPGVLLGHAGPVIGGQRLVQQCICKFEGQETCDIQDWSSCPTQATQMFGDGRLHEEVRVLRTEVHTKSCVDANDE